ncbi:MAG TPA: von Willebrand factor type A domain-containing protein, partial [Pirellulales bacterium]|nr:von Willebrand factor type A domain-containing protein [Pirellulales bacterium]
MSRREELREEFEDRLFDQGLAEIARNRRPPDLTARVLSAVNAPPRYHGQKTIALRGLMVAATIGLIVGVWRINYMREAGKQVAVVGKSRAESRLAPPTTDKQLALLVDEFNRLIKEKRFDEAEDVYQRAAKLAPDELVVQQMKNTVKLVGRTRNNRAFSEQGRETVYAVSDVGGESTAPKDNRRPYQFGPISEWQKLAARRRNRREGIADSLFDYDLSRIPTPDEPPIFYPDPETWRMLAERRKKYRGVDLSEDEADNTAALAALDEKTEFDFTDQPLQDVLDCFQAKHDVEIQLDKNALEESGVGVNPPITRKVKGISLRSALRLLLGEFELTYVVRNGGLLITTKHEAENLIAKDAHAEREARDRYSRIIENPFLAALDNPLSTFSIDVDTASYAKVRRYLLDEGALPPPDAVRIEELINYFDYDYAPPEGDAPFAAHVEVTACPWQLKHRLLRIGLKGREILEEARPATNLVFLLDVSGSMEPDDKLPRVRRAMRLLVEQLRENDRVAIVVYAAQSGLVLPSTTGFEKDRILAALDSLHAGGGTNGGDGIRLAYHIAQKSFQKDGINRVILCTDGDFNVGTTSNAELERLIEDRAKSGVFLTLLGFGMGNHNDELMEKLADKGNG